MVTTLCFASALPNQKFWLRHCPTPEHSLIYLDNMIIFSTTFQEHRSRLRGVLGRLLRAGLQVKTSKCQFARKEVWYLGHIVSEQGIYPDPQKIEAVEKLPTPRNAKELRQFLGLSNYYPRFICNVQADS